MVRLLWNFVRLVIGSFLTGLALGFVILCIAAIQKQYYKCFLESYSCAPGNLIILPIPIVFFGFIFLLLLRRMRQLFKEIAS
jgi:hypothetical protein